MGGISFKNYNPQVFERGQALQLQRQQSYQNDRSLDLSERRVQMSEAAMAAAMEDREIAARERQATQQFHAEQFRALASGPGLQDLPPEFQQELRALNRVAQTGQVDPRALEAEFEDVTRRYVAYQEVAKRERTATRLAKIAGSLAGDDKAVEAFADLIGGVQSGELAPEAGMAQGEAIYKLAARRKAIEMQKFQTARQIETLLPALPQNVALELQAATFEMMSDPDADPSSVWRTFAKAMGGDSMIGFEGSEELTRGMAAIQQQMQASLAAGDGRAARGAAGGGMPGGGAGARGVSFEAAAPQDREAYERDVLAALRGGAGADHIQALSQRYGIDPNSLPEDVLARAAQAQMEGAKERNPPSKAAQVLEEVASDVGVSAKSLVKAAADRVVAALEERDLWDSSKAMGQKATELNRQIFAALEQVLTMPFKKSGSAEKVAEDMADKALELLLERGGEGAKAQGVDFPSAAEIQNARGRGGDAASDPAYAHFREVVGNARGGGR